MAVLFLHGVWLFVASHLGHLERSMTAWLGYASVLFSTSLCIAGIQRNAGMPQSSRPEQIRGSKLNRPDKFVRTAVAEAMRQMKADDGYKMTAAQKRRQPKHVRVAVAQAMGEEKDRVLKAQELKAAQGPRCLMEKIPWVSVTIPGLASGPPHRELPWTEEIDDPSHFEGKCYSRNFLLAQRPPMYREDAIYQTRKDIIATTLRSDRTSERKRSTVKHHPDKATRTAVAEAMRQMKADNGEEMDKAF